MRTTIDIPDPLFKAVKTRAAEEGVKLKDLMKAYIEAGLRNQHPPEVPRRRSPLPVFRKPDGNQTPALTNQQIEEILDEEDIASHFKSLSH